MGVKSILSEIGHRKCLWFHEKTAQSQAWRTTRLLRVRLDKGALIFFINRLERVREKEDRESADRDNRELPFDIWEEHVDKANNRHRRSIVSAIHVCEEHGSEQQQWSEWILD